MKQLLILGAGTAGTMMANKLRRALPEKEWAMTIVDRDETHYYQPGFIFIPFGIYEPEDVVRPKRDFIPDGVNFRLAEVEKIEPDENRVLLAGGDVLDYDLLIIATGTTPRPEETPGLKGDLWYTEIFDFYTFEGSSALGKRLKTWEGGRLVISLAESIFKCPVAPLEFAFLADAYFEERGMRDRVEILYVTPLSGAFTKPIATRFLGDLLEEKGVKVIPDFYLERVDEKAKKLISYDDREVEFDLLVSVPVNMGADFIDESDMGDEDDLNYVPTDKHTLRSKDHENIFVIGDATNVPTSKAGSVAHFEADVLFENIMSVVRGEEPHEKFDGHANCFIETGHGKAALIDFNYDVEPLPGMFPLPWIGPMTLLEESRMNHLGKLAFQWAYWHMLLTGRKIPVSTDLSMKGKKTQRETVVT